MSEVISAKDRLRANKARLESLVSAPGGTEESAGLLEPVAPVLGAGEVVTPISPVAKVAEVVEVTDGHAVDDVVLPVETNAVAGEGAQEEVGVVSEPERMLEARPPFQNDVAEALPLVTEAVAAPPTRVELAQAISRVTSADGGEARFAAENQLRDMLSRWDSSVPIPRQFQERIDALSLDASKPTEPTAAEAMYPVKDQADREGVLSCVRQAIADTINFPADMIEESNTMSGDLMIDEERLQAVLQKLGVPALQFNLTNEATVDNLVAALSIQYHIGETQQSPQVDEIKAVPHVDDRSVEAPVKRKRGLKWLQDRAKAFADRVVGPVTLEDIAEPSAQRTGGVDNRPNNADAVLQSLAEMPPGQTTNDSSPAVSEELPVVTLSMEEVLTKVRSFLDTDVAEAIKAGNENPAKIQAELAKLREAILLNITEVRVAMGILEKPDQVKPAVDVIKNLVRLAVSAKIVSPEAQQLRIIGSVADLAQSTEGFLNHYSDSEELKRFSDADKTSLELLINQWWRVLVDVAKPGQQKDLIDKELVPLLLLEAKARLLKKW